jgi:homoserine dehydrogenase
MPRTLEFGNLRKLTQVNLCYTRTDDIKDLSALRSFLVLRSANAIEVKDAGAGVDETDAGICGDIYELLTTRASKV